MSKSRKLRNNLTATSPGAIGQTGEVKMYGDNLMDKDAALRQQKNQAYQMQTAENAANGIGSLVGQIQQAPVDSALDRLSSVISNARDEFSQIDSRLAAILGPQNQGTALGSSNMPMASPSCALESRINDMRYSVETLVEQMRSIRQSLCI